MASILLQLSFKKYVSIGQKRKKVANAMKSLALSKKYFIYPTISYFQSGLLGQYICLGHVVLSTGCVISIYINSLCVPVSLYTRVLFQHFGGQKSLTLHGSKIFRSSFFIFQHLTGQKSSFLFSLALSEKSPTQNLVPRARIPQSQVFHYQIFSLQDLATLFLKILSS